MEGVLVDQGVCLNIPAIEGIPCSATYYVLTREGGGYVCYIAIASHVLSLVLIRVDNGVQRPVYYVSKSSHEAEVRYLPLEKVVLAVVHATRKLPHYFQSHKVVVLT